MLITRRRRSDVSPAFLDGPLHFHGFLIKPVWLTRQIIVWNDVYGFDYSPMLPIVLKEPLVDCVELKSVVTKPCLIKVSAVSKQIRSAIMIKCGKRQKDADFGRFVSCRF
jgi:hypothetical protein